MALEGGYNPESIANSVCACAKVLLGDKFTLTSPEMQPFESTWRVIQMVMVCSVLFLSNFGLAMRICNLVLIPPHTDQVRDELKTYWPVLSSKLPENVSLRSTPSYIQVNFIFLFSSSWGLELGPAWSDL